MPNPEFRPLILTQENNHVFRYALLFILWILLALIGIEVILRILIQGTIEYSYDPVWGTRPVKGTTVVWGTEGYGITHFISDGEIWTPFTGGTNIVVLGDSHTDAYQVSDNDKFVSVAEKILRQQHFEVDLHNLGNSGSSLADYVYLAPLIQERYKPQIIVIQISAQDFGSSGYQEAFDTSRMNYFVYSEDAPLFVKHAPNYQNTWLLKIKHSLALLDYGYERFKQIQLRNTQNKIVTSPLVVKADSTVLNDSKKITRLQLEALRTAFVDVPVIIIVLPDIPRIKDGAIVTREPEYDSLLETVRSIPEWHVVDPLDAFTKMISDGQFPRGFPNTVPGEGHLNTHGHAIIGAMLAEQIEELLR